MGEAVARDVHRDERPERRLAAFSAVLAAVGASAALAGAVLVDDSAARWLYTLFAVAAVLGLGFSVRAARGVLDARAPDSAELDDVADLLVDLQIQEKRAEQVPITEPGPRSPTVPDAIARMRTERPELYERVQQKRRERGLPPYPDPPD